MLREIADNLTIEKSLPDGTIYRRVLVKEILSVNSFHINIFYIAQNKFLKFDIWNPPYCVLVKYRVNRQLNKAFPISRFRFSFGLVSRLSVILKKNFLLFSDIHLEHLKKIREKLNKFSKLKNN